MLISRLIRAEICPQKKKTLKKARRRAFLSCIVLLTEITTVPWCLTGQAGRKASASHANMVLEKKVSLNNNMWLMQLVFLQVPSIFFFFFCGWLFPPNIPPFVAILGSKELPYSGSHLWSQPGTSTSNANRRCNKKLPDGKWSMTPRKYPSTWRSVQTLEQEVSSPLQITQKH